jgi:hypothetical protein
VIWFVLKAFFVFFMFAMVKAFVPRYRYDQLMRLGWKVFLPLSLAMWWSWRRVLQVRRSGAEVMELSLGGFVGGDRRDRDRRRELCDGGALRRAAAAGARQVGDRGGAAGVRRQDLGDAAAHSRDRCVHVRRLGYWLGLRFLGPMLASGRKSGEGNLA